MRQYRMIDKTRLLVSATLCGWFLLLTAAGLLPGCGPGSPASEDQPVDEAVKELADQLAQVSFPGNQFHTVTAALAEHSDSFSPADVRYVVNAYMKLIEREYIDWGDFFTGVFRGWFIEAHELIRDTILMDHKDTVCQVLEEHLNSDDPQAAFLAAQLLTYYGDESSAPKMEEMMSRFPEDKAIVAIVPGFVAVLRQ
jgi:hypothetical protein